MGKRQPTLAQKKFIKEYLQTGKIKQSAMKAYPNAKETTAATVGQKNLHSPIVKSYMQDLLDYEGLSDEKIAKKLNKIVDAGTTRRALKSTTPKDALQAIKFSAEITDKMPAKKIEQKSANLNMNIEGKSEKELQEMLTDISSEIKAFQEMVKKQSKKEPDYT